MRTVLRDRMLAPPPPRALTGITLPPDWEASVPCTLLSPSCPLCVGRVSPSLPLLDACLFLRKGFLIFAAQGGMNSRVGTDTYVITWDECHSLCQAAQGTLKKEDIGAHCQPPVHPSDPTEQGLRLGSYSQRAHNMVYSLAPL